MENLTIIKNKENTFNCEFQADGVNVNDLIVRLCLELNDNTNLHFYGSVNDEGSCQITIPKLNVEGKKGDMFIEAIADNVYFKLYEAKVEVKNSVELKMKVTESTMKNEKVSLNGKITILGFSGSNIFPPLAHRFSPEASGFTPRTISMPMMVWPLRSSLQSSQVFLAFGSLRSDLTTRPLSAPSLSAI